MKRYFFHISYGDEFPDREGTSLPDLKSARRNAVELLGRMLVDESDSFWDKPNIVVTVADADGLVLWTVETIGLASTAVGKRA